MFVKLAVSWIFLFGSTLSLFTPSDDVVKLTDADFSQVTSSDGLWLVMFYASWCGHSKNAAPEWKKVAGALKGIIRVGAVDADAEKSISQYYKISGFPTILVFGQDKSNPSTYKGGRDASVIIDEAMRQLKIMVDSRSGRSSSGGSHKNEVIELTDSNFDTLVMQSNEPWLVEFFAPWCGHCQNLKPHWEQAARELVGIAKLGALDATVYGQMAQRYGVQGYPTIKFFPSGPKTSPIDYDGPRSSEAIVSWVTEKVDVFAPPPSVNQLTSDSEFRELCEDHKICIISFLPVLFDCQSDCRNKYIDLIKKEAEAFKKQKWGWFWTGALDHPEFENVLDVGGSGYPAMVAVHMKKQKRTTMRGSFTHPSIHEFLFSLSVGGTNLPLFDLGAVPKLKTVELWDGKDAQYEEEDDYGSTKTEL